MMFTEHRRLSRFFPLIVWIFGFCIVLLLDSRPVFGVRLVGVTVECPPFVYTENNRFSGLAIDLLDLIRDRTGLNYSLYLVQDNTYGPGSNPNRVAGLIGDVYSKKADFAIGDLTVTLLRERYVNFTRPFFIYSFSALVRKELATNIETIDDLAAKSNLSVGVFLDSRTMAYMSQIRQNIFNVRWLYKQILKDQSNMVRTMDEALDKVKNQPYAFIQEEPKNQYYASMDCSLKVLRDQNFYMASEYAIAMQHNSPYIDRINQALHRLDNDGALKRLRKRYFSDKRCNQAFTTELNHFLMTILAIIVMGYHSFIMHR